MAKITSINNGEAGSSVRSKLNTAMASVETDATLTGDGNVGTALSVDFSAATPITVDGTADVVQCTIQGHSTQTADIFIVENSAGTDLLTVDNSGNVTVAGTVDGRDLATDGTKLDGIEAGADVTDATNVNAALQGISAVELGAGFTGDRACYIDFHADDTNTDYGARILRNGGVNGATVFNNLGTGGYLFSVNGTSFPLSLGINSSSIQKRLNVIGYADDVQLLVRGNAVQTSDIFVVETSAGTDLLTVDNSGNLSVAGEIDHGLVWKDLIGTPVARTSGLSDPAFVAFRGASCDAYAFGVGEEIQFWFHMPHDYALGTDIFLHVHWSHNGTAISGNMTWAYAATYAKGHGQAIFPAEVTGNITYATTDITTTPQYIHRVDEIQLSASTPSASQIDTDDLEPDGLIGINISASAIPSITGGTPNEPFLFTVDIHYQADVVGTKNKSPNFYA